MSWRLNQLNPNKERIFEMKAEFSMTVVAAFLSTVLLAAGPGGGGAPGGGGGSSGAFSYDSVIAASTTNSDGSVSRDGVIVGYTTSATKLKPSSSIKAFVDGAFAGNTSLVSVDLSSSSVTEIPPYCFAGCTSLATVVLPATVVAVDAGAFAGCTALSSVVCTGVDEVGDDAFRDCTALASITDLRSADLGICVFANCPLFDYTITFVRNDGAGKLKAVEFPFAIKTRIPALVNGFGWARRGYDFKGWETTTANASDNTRTSPWKADWAYVSTPVAAGGSMYAYARWQLKDGCYQIRFNKNDGSGKWRTLGFECGVSTKLSSIAALGWERDGCTFKGWGSNKANADAGKVWKADGAWVKDATAEGKTLSIYAIW